MPKKNIFFAISNLINQGYPNNQVYISITQAYEERCLMSVANVTLK